MPSALVETTRDVGDSNAPEPEATSVEISPSKRGQTVPDAVEEWIRPLNPSLTGKSCVYSFDSSEYGKGMLRVRMKGSMYRERMDEKVQIMAIEREIGWQPAKLSDSPVWQYGIRLQVRNPYLQVLVGGGAISVGLAVFLLPHPSGGGLQDAPFLAIGAIAILLGSYYWVLRGLRRFRWWHRARAVVRRNGERMPEELRVIA